MPSARRVKSISMKLPVDLLDRLEKAANDRVLGRHLLIELLLEDGVENLIPVNQLVRPQPVIEADS